MKNKLIYFTSALVVILLVITSFKSTGDNKKYEYLTILSENHDLDGVFCSVDGKEYKHYTYEKETKGVGDLNPLINLIHDYENEGWELISVELNSAKGSHGFWLRRLKK